MKIDSFRGKYYFLSNMFPVEIEIEGLVFDNSESAFQAMKCKFYEDRRYFVGINGFKAKQKGKLIALRDDWEAIKNDVMYEVIKAKFTQNNPLKQQLLATGDDILIEGNTWNDTYWGKCRGRGQNNLGKILMRVRAELR